MAPAAPCGFGGAFSSPSIPGDRLSSSAAPTARVFPSPLRAIEELKASPPGLSPFLVFDASTYASCDQEVPRRVKTYAAPEPGAVLSSIPLTPVEPPSSSNAQTASVLPAALDARQKPNR